MPRNGSGTYAVPTSFTSGSTISSSSVNANFTDVGSELSNSLPRDGQAAMTGQFKAASGTAAAPGLTFGSDTDTGFYRKSADTIGVAVGGAEVGEFSSKGTSFIPAGMIAPYIATTAPSGWVRANGRTIGNAASSATERANADTQTLYELLWNSYSDSVCAVSSGRGSTAALDYAANKTITLPDLRGRSWFGLDDMGNTPAARIGTVLTTPTTNGTSGGTETVTLSSSEMPAHTHDLSSHTHSVSGTTGTQSADHTHGAGTLAADSSGAHTHTESAPSGSVAAGTGGNSAVAGGTTTNTGSNGAHVHTISGSTGTTSANHDHTFSATSGTPSNNTSGSTGSTSAHSNMPPAFLGTFIIKL